MTGTALALGPDEAAASVAAAWMVLHDPAAQINASTFHRQAPLYQAVLDATFPVGAPDELGTVRLALSAGEDRDAAHARVAALVRAHLQDTVEDVLADALADVAQHGLTHLWLGGDDATTDVAVVSATDPSPLDVAVVVPVRLREAARARNLDTVLRVLRRTALPGDRLQVCVVEQDDTPRVPRAVHELADKVVFAYNPGPFNKGWAVNVGVDHTDAATICVLDADYILTRDALSAAVRDAREAAVAFPHMDAVWLDAPSTARIAERAAAPTLAPEDVTPRTTTGYVLRDTLGLCVVVRRELFELVDGFDERYEGWGDEDNDLVRRLAEHGPVLRSPAVGMHLDHPRPPMTDDDGVRPNKRLVATPRPTDRPRRGDLDRYRGAPAVATPRSAPPAGAEPDTQTRQ